MTRSTDPEPAQGPARGANRLCQSCSTAGLGGERATPVITTSHLAIALALLLPPTAFAAEAWIGFRGGSLGGASQEEPLPVTFEEFFRQASVHPNAHLITGVICGYRIEEIEDPLTRQARYLDKLVDELRRVGRWRRS